MKIYDILKQKIRYDKSQTTEPLYVNDLFIKNISYYKKIKERLFVYQLQDNSLYKRYGNNTDGGYVVCDYPYSIMYSLGIGDNISFESDFINTYNCHVYAYDENIFVDNDLKNFLHIHNYYITKDMNLYKELINNKHNNMDMILKIDIEGDEYDVLDFSFYNNFQQIIIELHSLLNIDNYKKIIYLLDVLSKYYYIIHIHANNSEMVFYLENFILPDTLELTLLRKDCNVLIKNNERIFPTMLDYPNKLWRQDIMLGVWNE